MTRLAAFTVIALFVIAERVLRRGQAARTLETTPEDQGTTRQIGAAFALALVAGALSPLVARFEIVLPTPRWLSLAGLPLTLAGLGLRIWSAITLGRFYTRTLRIAADQHVVQSGPYAVVRHPGYLADLVMWLGFGLCSGSWLVASTITAVMVRAYARRIHAEEAMLCLALGEAYERYSERTSRLVPGLY